MLRPDLTLKKYKSAEKTLPRLAMEKYVKKGGRGKENGGGIWVRAFGQLHTPFIPLPPPFGLRPLLLHSGKCRGGARKSLSLSIAMWVGFGIEGYSCPNDVATTQL